MGSKAIFLFWLLFAQLSLFLPSEIIVNIIWDEFGSILFITVFGFWLFLSFLGFCWRFGVIGSASEL